MRRHRARSVVRVGVLQAGVHPEDGHGAQTSTAGLTGGAGRCLQTRGPCRAPHANGIELEYDTFGDPSDPALLLVMGFTAQMTAWDEELCKLLADEGLYVIRFDNRDCGLSTKLDGVQVDLGPFLVALMAHEAPPADATVPYKLTDMAADAIGLLDHLGIERAHIVGRLDGRDDRADDGHRAPRAGARR